MCCVSPLGCGSARATVTHRSRSHRRLRTRSNYPSIRVSQEQINAAAAGDPIGANSVPAESGRACAGQSGDPKQRLRHAAAAERYSIDVRSGHWIEQFRDRYGEARWAGWSLGAVRFWSATAPTSRLRPRLARSRKRRSRRTQFEVSVAAVDAYLTLVAAQETVRAAQAGVDRAMSFVRTITAQVNAQLRPGADAVTGGSGAGGRTNVN